MPLTTTGTQLHLLLVVFLERICQGSYCRLLKLLNSISAHTFVFSGSNVPMKLPSVFIPDSSAVGREEIQMRVFMTHDIPKSLLALQEDFYRLLPLSALLSSRRLVATCCKYSRLPFHHLWGYHQILIWEELSTKHRQCKLVPLLESEAQHLCDDSWSSTPFWWFVSLDPLELIILVNSMWVCRLLNEGMKSASHDVGAYWM